MPDSILGVGDISLNKNVTYPFFHWAQILVQEDISKISEIRDIFENSRCY